MDSVPWQQYGETDIHPVALVFTLVMGVLLLGSRRSHAMLPLLLVASLIPFAQRIVISTLDFNMVRILIVFGWARLWIYRLLNPSQLRS